MDIIEFLRKESDQFQKGWKRVRERKLAWEKFEDKAVTQFNSLCTEAKTQKLFERLYVDNTKKHQNENIRPPQYVTLFWGSHPTGETDFRETIKNKLVIEGGCALHYTQFPSGEVAVIFYPFQSNLSEPLKKHYIYKIYSSPEEISDSCIQHHIKLMFSYAHYSSFLGMSRISDWLRMKWLQIRSKLREVWHADWIEFMFNRAQKVIEKQIEGLVESDGNKSSNK